MAGRSVLAAGRMSSCRLNVHRGAPTGCDVYVAAGLDESRSFSQQRHAPSLFVLEVAEYDREATQLWHVPDQHFSAR